MLDVFEGWVIQHLPLITLDIVIEVHLFQAIVERDVQFEAIIGPAAELKEACLFVEREVRDVYDTGGFEDRLWDP